MMITKDNLKDLKIGQRVYEAHWGFKMIDRTIYLGIYNISPEGSDWKKHLFFNDKNSFSFTAELGGKSKAQLPEKLRMDLLYTTYEEACIKSRELALNCIDHYNTHDFKNNPIIIKDET